MERCRITNPWAEVERGTGSGSAQPLGTCGAVGMLSAVSELRVAVVQGCVWWR